jgi:hypothetical protein
MPHDRKPSYEPIDADDMNPRKKPPHERALEPDEHARRPDSEPPNEERIEDL